MRFVDEHKVSETRSTTPGKSRRQTGGLSPSSHSQARRNSPAASCGRDRGGGEVFIKVSSEKAGNINLRTRGGGGRKNEEGGERSHPNHHRGRHIIDDQDGECHRRPSGGYGGHDLGSDTNDRPHSHPNQTQVPNGSLQRVISPQNQRHIPNNSNENSVLSSAGGHSTNSPDANQSGESYSSSSATSGSVTFSVQSKAVFRYTVEELRQLRYMPASNRKPGGLHSMIDRTKTTPPLSLYPRTAPRLQQSGPSRTRRAPEMWGGVNPVSTTRRESQSSVTDGIGRRREHGVEIEGENVGPVNCSTSQESRKSNTSSRQINESTGPQGPPSEGKVEPDLSKKEPGDNSEKLVAPIDIVSESSSSAVPGSTAISSDRVGTTTASGNAPRETSTGVTETPIAIPSVHKSTMGSADVAPFVPRNQQQQQMGHFLNQVRNDAAVGMDHSSVRHTERALVTNFGPDGGVVSCHPQHGGHNHLYEPHQYPNTGAASPVRRSQHVPAVDSQKDPSFNNYGFNSANQTRYPMNSRQHFPDYNHLQPNGGHILGHHVAHPSQNPAHGMICGTSGAWGGTNDDHVVPRGTAIIKVGVE